MRRKTSRRKSLRRKTLRRKPSRRKTLRIKSLRRMLSRRNKSSRKSKLKKKNKKTSGLIYKGGMETQPVVAAAFLGGPTTRVGPPVVAAAVLGGPTTRVGKRKMAAPVYIPATSLALPVSALNSIPTMHNNDELIKISEGAIGRADVVGSGASGQVYRFNEPASGEDCIIKTYTESGKAAAIEINVILEIEKLKNIQIIEGINCFEKIIQFCNNYKYATDPSGGNIYISLKYGGESLKKFIESEENDNPLDGESRLKICNGLSDAIKCFHRMGFIHRDLKPANIILGPDNQPILIDFGSTASIPRSEGPLKEGTLDLLKASELMTKDYMGPNLSGDVEHGTLFCRGCFYDMWSLLVTITEMVIKPSKPNASLYKMIFSRETTFNAQAMEWTIQGFYEEKGNAKFGAEMGKFKTGAILVKWQELFDVKEQSISISGPLPLEEVSISSLLDDKTFTGEDFLLK